jgi:hypothetical protein
VLNPGVDAVATRPSPSRRTATATFADVARRLAVASRAAGLAVPAFRSPPRRPGALRTIRRLPGGAVVSVRVRDRALPDVAADMVEGVVVANRLTGEAAARVRDALLAALHGEASAGKGSAAA